jgi:catechol 2,3-dioxygenase-like lactoylglutathione lyase family enzyme
MIRGVHTMFYTSEAEALRAFLRDKLGFPCTDVGDGWLIFDLPEADMGCHPADDVDGGRSGTHAISFYCDDIERTVAELKERGVEFTAPIEDHGYGLVTFFKVPGGFELQLYQPKYEKGVAMRARGS